MRAMLMTRVMLQSFTLQVVSRTEGGPVEGVGKGWMDMIVLRVMRGMRHAMFLVFMRGDCDTGGCGKLGFSVHFRPT